MPRIVYARLLLAATASLPLGCSRDTLLVTSRGVAEAGPPDAGLLEDAGLGDASFQVSDAGLALCGKHVCACSNQEDDDLDRFADGFDDECTGAFDDDEASLGTGGIKIGNAQCANCFFGGHPGLSEDPCRISVSCLQGGLPQRVPASCSTCDPSTECVDSCLARTPNGCDCFGCCEVRLQNGSVVKVMLAAECSIEGNLVQGCQACVPNEACFNECGPCELCPGKTLADLPDECQREGGVACEGSPVCAPENPCDLGQWCGFGCCLDLL
jgi:hypothetical protein